MDPTVQAIQEANVQPVFEVEDRALQLPCGLSILRLSMWGISKRA